MSRKKENAKIVEWIYSKRNNKKLAYLYKI